MKREFPFFQPLHPTAGRELPAHRELARSAGSRGEFIIDLPSIPGINSSDGAADYPTRQGQLTDQALALHGLPPMAFGAQATLPFRRLVMLSPQERAKTLWIFLAHWTRPVVCRPRVQPRAEVLVCVIGPSAWIDDEGHPFEPNRQMQSMEVSMRGGFK